MLGSLPRHLPRSRPRPSAALVVASLALVVSCTGAAVAAGGGSLLLGSSNKATATTTLKSTAGVKQATLKVRNSGGGPAASFVTKGGRAPFTVSAKAKVARLNADLFDGLDSTGFLKPGDSVNADKLDGLDSSAFRRTGAPVDAETLDGLDSTSFRKTNQPVDAASLGGYGPSSYLRNDSTPLTASVRAGGTQTTATTVPTVLTPTTEDFDPSDLHTDAQPQRLAVPRTGTYLVSATVSWAAGASGYRRTTLIQNDGTVFAAVEGASLAGATTQNVFGIVHLPANTDVRVQVVQGSGADLNAQLLAFQITYVGA